MSEREEIEAGLVYVEELAASATGAVSEHALRGALQTCISLTRQALSTPKGEEVCRSDERSVASANAPGRYLEPMLRAYNAAMRAADTIEAGEPTTQKAEALRKEVAFLRPLIQELEQAPTSPWRSIDDMPEEIKRDGVCVLLSGFEGVGEGVYKQDGPGIFQGGWRSPNDMFRYPACGSNPTHWMVLPLPPVQEESS